MKSLKVWGITDGSAGMVSQVLGLTQALGFPTVMKVCHRSPWVSWMPGNWFTDKSYLVEGSDPLTAPWPDIVVTCGRKSVALGIHIKKQTQGRAFVIHIQDPRINSKHLDLVVAMDHDRISGPNVHKVFMAMQHVTQDKLHAARIKYAAQFNAMPQPLCAVMVGGSTHRFSLRNRDMDQLSSDLKLLMETFPGSILITPSRRTDPKHVDLLRKAFPDTSRVFIADLAKDNPYFGFLSLADYFIVTDDSVSMMSEACATGKTVYTYALPSHKFSKAKEFSHRLHQQGNALNFQGSLFPNPHPFVDETAQTAQLILTMFKERQFHDV